MPQERLVAVGLDMGTGGARAVAVDFEGRILAEGRSPLASSAKTVVGLRVEQDPRAWTASSQAALREMSNGLPDSAHIVGISVDATSGTFLLADADNQPLTRGIMYNDQRASTEWQEAADALREVLLPFGIQIASSFALAKIAFLARNAPEVFERCHRIVHQTDWIVGPLCGRYDVTDVSTALKTGANPRALAWPEEIERLGVSRDLLPEIVQPGTLIGKITEAASTATGLPISTPVVAGCTDGTAGCLASGARETGDLNVTLGSTLVFKAVAEHPLIDSGGAIYNHRHPAGGYLPGAASSTGAEWIEKYCPHSDLRELNQSAWEEVPTGQTAFPLIKTGERFPFACPEAVGFGLDEIDSRPKRFAAGMEGVALLERMGIERLEQLGLPIGDTVYATGGGVEGATWLKIRAAVNRRCYSVPRHPDCAVGAAVLAAIPHLGTCRDAVAAIVRTGHQVDPVQPLVDAYEDAYKRFKKALRLRGYL